MKKLKIENQPASLADYIATLALSTDYNTHSHASHFFNTQTSHSQNGSNKPFQRDLMTANQFDHLQFKEHHFSHSHFQHILSTLNQVIHLFRIEWISGEFELWQFAAISGHLPALQNLLGDKLATHKDSQHRSAYHFLALGGHLNLLKALLSDESCDFEYINQPEPLLKYAALGGNIETTFYIIEEFGQHANKLDALGANALHYASSGGNTTLCTQLLDLNIPANDLSNSGNCCLHFAAHGGHWGCLDMLSTRCSLPYTTLNSNNLNILHYAAASGDLQRFKRIQAQCEQTTPGQTTDNTLLESALESGNIDVIDYLMDECGLSFNQPNQALIRALRANNAEFIIKLVDIRELDPEANDQTGDTLLHHVAKLGFWTLFHTLSESLNLDIDVQNDYGHTPLMKAYLSGNFNFVTQYHKTFEVDSANITDLNQNSLLHMAVPSQNVALIKYCVDELHLSPDTENNDHHTPLEAYQLKSHDFLEWPLVQDSEYVEQIKSVFENTHMEYPNIK